MISSIAGTPRRPNVTRTLRAGLFAALALSIVGCDEDPGIDFQHGSVKLEFRRGDGQAESPFIGTTVMQVTLNYEACLIDFYKANPNWRAQGPDGDTVFGARDLGGEGWKDGLCELGNVGCEVIDFTQQLDDNQGNFLSVLYSISDFNEVENRTLHFGPVPLPALAQCEAGSEATVRVATNGAARGLDGVPPDGNVLWSIQKFDPAKAVANQGGSISIDAELSD
ncbi:MAG: hypothetical protein AAF721_10830 [Myxococcota bacterium]